jgi:hypothetical protein
MAENHFLSTALGTAGSGRVRYGAAMALWRDGALSADQLECYRIASTDDRLDPTLLLRERGLAAPLMTTPSPETLIRSLLAEADRYIATLPGPGPAEVRQGIAAFRDRPFAPQVPAPNAVVDRHLQEALAAAAVQEPQLAALISAAAPHLHWITYDLYDSSKIGDTFATSHAYCTIMGAAGPLPADDFDLGLFLIAPHVLYRDHRHAAPELYAPLTGPHGWRFRPDGPLTLKPAHEPVWNEPFRPHLTKVGPTPFLCLYGWTRDNDKPAEVLPAADWPELEKLRL